MAQSNIQTLKRLVGRLGVADIFGIGVSIFLVLTVPAYVANSIDPWWINDDARQQVWTIRTLIDPTFPSDLFSRYMLDKTIPDAFVWLAVTLSRIIGSPEPLFKWIGLLSLASCGVFGWLSGRKVGGPLVGWAVLLIIFATDGIADSTAGGLPRATGVALTLAGFYAYLGERPRLGAAASILGGLLYYPAAVICGALFALQLLAPKSWLNFPRQRSLIIRIAIVAVVGALTALPVVPDLLGSNYGKLIPASSTAWPEAGRGGRWSEENLMGISRPVRLVAKGIAGTWRSDEAPWRPASKTFNRIGKVLCILVFAAMSAVLVARARSDAVARRLLAAVALGLVLFFVTNLAAPWAYVPSRYLALLGLYSLIGLPYALARLPELRLKWFRWPLSPAATIITGVLLVVAVAGGRLSAQGLTVRPSASEREVLDYLASTPPDTEIAGWPTGMINDVPYFAHRRVLLSQEMHLPWHEVYAKETRARAISLIAAWYSTSPRDLYALHDQYGANLFIIDKALLPHNADYFVPFTEMIHTKQKSLGEQELYVARPEPASIAFQNQDYVVVRINEPPHN